jgi:Fe-S-cluster containining protein
MPDKVPFQVTITTPRGTSVVEFGVSPEPMRLSELVPFAQELATVQTERRIACEADEGRTLSCKAGCGACCRQLVPISPPEAFALASMAVRLPPEERDELIARVERTVRQIEERGAIGRLRELISGTANFETMDLEAIAADHFDLGIACPFLIDESCSIHPHRPTTCREYNVTPPAAWCAEPRKHALRMVPIALPMSPALSRVTARFTGGQPTLVPLPLAFEYAEANVELAFKRWPGPELVKAFVEEFGATSQDRTSTTPS